jgi:ABC-type sugar transport system ATPase subunit
MVEIRLRAVSKRFGDTVVLDGIDASFPDRSFVVLVGKSGCGKSTLLRCIAGLEEVTEGGIEFGGRDVTHLAPRERDVAMVFQSYALYPHMTVRRNLAFGLELRKEKREVIDARVAEVAKLLEIEPLLDRHPRALSGGQRQRVAMGRAIVRRPAVFMFDEPLSNLDPTLRNQVRVDIRRMHDDLGATSIYVTHDQVEAMTLADVLVVLDRGVVQQIGAPLEVYRDPANRFVAGFVGSPAMNFLEGRIAEGPAPSVEIAGGVRIALPAGTPALAAGTTLDVGIRPHDVRRDPEGTVELRVELVETLGSHVHVHGRIGDTVFVAAFEGHMGPRKGERIALSVERVHLFDPERGVALR